MGFRRKGLDVSFIASTILFTFLAATTWAQRSSLARITDAVDEAKLTVLRGNVHPLAQKQFDQGPAPSAIPLHRMLLLLQRSPLQEHALVTLLDAQQDKSSPSYHKWLTPDEFGQQFGPSDADVQTVTNWLQSHGFQITRVSTGRTIVEFEGTTDQVQQAFHTSIHSYLVNGEQHWANVSDPQIPAALAPVVAGPVSLHNFPRKAQSHYAGLFSKSKASPKLSPLNPQFTFQACGSNECYGVTPYDFATIYNVLPLWTSGIDGSGETIAIVGRSDINIQDTRDFRTLFGLPAHDPQIIYNGPNPGITGDESEADIDVQWSGAVARGATVDFVVSETTETTDGTDLSAEYIVDNNLAGVMSESFGNCELAFGTAGNAFYNSMWEQASAQGITVMISTGDSGSAGSDQGSGLAAQFGLAVNGIGSTPFNVAVGGTDFNDAANPQTYWSLSNNPTTQQSVLSYIPETAWNNSCTNGILGTFGYSTNAETNCNNPTLASFGLVQASGGSGGVSNCTSNTQTLGSCSGGYAKPAWQSGAGVPADGKRDLPDVSLFAANGVFNGNFYLICESDISQSGTCDVNAPFFDIAGFGGTSVASPAFAGIMALVNQKAGTRQGNANYVLYKLAAQQSATGCNSSNGSGSSCNFNDVTSGTIAMPCAAGSPNCIVNTSGHSIGILSGYITTPGYDPATGLGSINAANLVNNWSSVSFQASTTTLSLKPTTLTHGQSIAATIGVTPSAATGYVSLITSANKGVANFKVANGQAAGPTSALPGGTYTVHAHYAGDGTYGSSDSTAVTVTVAKENSSTALSLITFDAQGNILNPHATNAVYGSPYILRADVTPSSGIACTSCPSGTLTLTDNSSLLDGGSFVLNNQGYAEDRPVQFPGGADAVIASYPGDNSFNSSSASATYSITRASTAMTAVTSSAASVLTGTPVTLSTTIQTSSSGLAPSGAVTFLANGTPLTGTVTYSPTNGSFSGNASLVAMLTTTFAPVGKYALTASYGGDTNYNSSTSDGVTLTVGNFSLSVGTPPVTLTISSPGSSGSLPLMVTGQTGYTGTINFAATSCSGLPRESSCTFNPASVTGSGPTTLTVTTTGPHSAAKLAGLSLGTWWMTGFGSIAFGMVLVDGRDRRRWTRLATSVVVALLLILPACGGGSGSGGGGTDPGTPIGTYSVTVTGTSGGVSSTTTFILVVQ